MAEGMCVMRYPTTRDLQARAHRLRRKLVDEGLYWDRPFDPERPGDRAVWEEAREQLPHWLEVMDVEDLIAVWFVVELLFLVPCDELLFRYAQLVRR